ncbi:MAG: valine--tRNA ligase [Candidatus Daviesbacteria bacterium]
MDKVYDQTKIEEKWYKFWEEEGLFKPEVTARDKKAKPYVLVIPPPNITGSLHMGHALNSTIQDILIRRSRMMGAPTLWVPGTDHAGIATQNKVEQKLASEGKTRFDLGKNLFVEEVWQWKEKYGHIIIDQLKKLGCSCDWSRERFTLDEDYAEAVNTAFKHYYQKGYIYKGIRVINWCPRCQTSLSDLEVEYIEKKSVLYFFRYDKNFPITIATTRPETKLGDTAVAVNPDDERYKKYVNQTFQVNLDGVKREIKIITDKSIDPKFGSGAVGITPAHSLVDAQFAQKYDLPSFQVIDPNGKMTKEAGEKYQGLSTHQASEKLLFYLSQEGLLEKQEDISNDLSICYRCQTPIEPIPSQQWFLKMDELKKPAIKAVKDGKIKFTPSRYKKIYLDWMENVHDWCISRQLWWGHKIPLEGEEDVLDTWFSSALWPFAVLGWPEQTPDLKNFYPTTVLSTARDIIFLWVARMIFSGLEFTKEAPFKDIYVHPTVFNTQGKRMSKSLGTGVDPLDLMAKYGTDATRFGLIYLNTGVQDIRFSEDALIAARNFTNKIWNAARFILTFEVKKETKQNKEDKEILEKLKEVVKSVNSDLDHYRFGQAAHTLYDFFWHDFCDKYLESTKPRRPEAQETLEYVLKTSLKLLHPFMPFITEELWQKLPHEGKPVLSKAEGSIMISPWPEVK